VEDEKTMKRVLIAKPGLDGHDKGAKIVARVLRDAGMEVIYTGLHQTVEQIVEAAIQEGVDVIGLSMMAGAHLAITHKLMKQLEKRGVRDMVVIVGGVIPTQEEINQLKQMGVAEVFPSGSSFESMVNFIKRTR